ncbi:MATE family efflux transporter [Winogradskyella sp. SYSU M77433]|uniref:MATE family efflux transporter n=1 Tax=Winogradskyella sp. SYSU M77433 TaxID=3042722 RepID=UPI00247FDB00|nr:MATE family efflux transporter [Winogradskyella sp. SYSU M77433]MDH7913709.1 MATE family efflux transporter [Winogradskyella sp. SYSU M77433]
MRLSPLFFKALKDPITKRSLSVLFLRVLGSGLQILILLLLTNYASEELVGQYNFFNSTILLLSSLTLLGMNTSFLQFVGKFEAYGNFGKIVSLYKRKLILLVSSYLLVIVTYIILSNGFDIEYFQDIQLMSVLDKALITLLPFSIAMLNFEVLRAFDMLYISELFRNIGRFGLFFIFLCVLILFDKISIVLDIFVISILILAIFSTILIVFKLMKIKQVYVKEKTSFIEIIKVSFPMSFSLISLLIMQSIDVYTLEYYYGFEIIAYYGIAVKISAIVGIILTSINATIAPKISELYFKKDKKNLRLIIKKATLLNATLSLPLIILIIFFSGQVFRLFGANYILAQNALNIILIGQIVNVLCGPVGLYLNMTSKQFFLQKTLVFALVINIITNFILIPKYEMLGAAISTAFSFIFWNIIGVIYVIKTDRVNLSVFNLLGGFIK